MYDDVPHEMPAAPLNTEWNKLESLNEFIHKINNINSKKSWSGIEKQCYRTNNAKLVLSFHPSFQVVA